MRTLTVGMTVLVVALASSAQAQFDHLKCFKAKDQKSFKSAQADLDALQTQFGVAESCTIKAKAKMFCVPAKKTVTAIEDGEDTPFPSEDLTFDRLCYKIKCPKADIGAEEVSDQFGTRTVEGFKAAMLCTPAVKGSPPTTMPCVPSGSEGCAADGVDNDCNGMVDDIVSCAIAEACCNDTCVNTDTDPNNCGACGVVCALIETCTAGVCS